VAEQAPKIESRTAADIVREVEELMRVDYAPEVIDPATRHASGVAAALIAIFGRFAELIIERLNQVPEKNLLAYLDMLGNSLLPPQPALAPLTFSLAAGSAAEALVPAGTQVAATAAEGETEPVIFETGRNLMVVAAKLAAAFVRVPDEDQYADLGFSIDSESTSGRAVFEADHAIEHVLYVARDDLFGLAGLSALTLTIELAGGQPDALDVRWERWNGERWTALAIAGDKTSKMIGGSLGYLAQSGDVSFDKVSPLERSMVWNKKSRWVRCRLLTPITASTKSPLIKSISFKASAARSGLTVDAAFAGGAPADVTKDFFPLGERPRPGDTFYIAAGEAFAEQGATVTLQMTIANAPLSDGSPKLRWEYWDGSAWFQLNPDARSGITPPDTAFSDQTGSFTKRGDGAVSFKFPTAPAATTINGIESFWIRVRLVSGDYGKAAQYVPLKDAAGNPVKDSEGNVKYQLVPETYAAPSISAIIVDYSLTRAGVRPDAVLAHNDFIFESFDDFAEGEFAPFRPTRDLRPTLYLGFVLPRERKTFPNKTVSIYCGFDQLSDGVAKGQTVEPAERRRLSWDYSSPAGWSDLQVSDESNGLTRPGVIEFLAPADFSTRAEFANEAYWLRAVWDSGTEAVEPRLRSLLLNTVVAAHASTVRGEILGSSNGNASQAFRTARAPVLEGPQLDVREPELPSAAEHEKLKTEAGEGAVSVGQTAAAGREIWVRWTQVPDFYASGPRDRHYVIEGLTGEVRFGDGVNGMVPPPASGNIRMTEYRTGGGDRGNKPAGAITQLKTTVPYVEKVTNHEPATGGADAETNDSMIERAPRAIRHRGRAVTVEDYEDLARVASPGVARARGVPLYDLEADPRATDVRPGVVSLIIVPQSNDAMPLATTGLLDRVREYVDARKSLTARLVVVGPEYVRVDVAVEAAVTSLEGASDVELAIAETLARFLHPLSGGLDGRGWDFGRRPRKSDLYALIEAVDGVDHIRSLTVRGVDRRTGRVMVEDADYAPAGTLFLVYSGAHVITLSFEEA